MAEETINQKIPPYMKAVSSSLGGIMEACCYNPLSSLKPASTADRTGSYKGIIQCGRTITKSGGVRALWKGLTPSDTHLTLKYALRMGSNALFESSFTDNETGKLSHRGSFMAGFGAAVLEALVIVTPFEVFDGIGLIMYVFIQLMLGKYPFEVVSSRLLCQN